MTANATMNQEGGIVCFTPAWGMSYAATVARVLLVETFPGASESIHTRVFESMFNFSFYPVFSNVSYTSSFGAKGGDVLSLSMIGADSSERYLAKYVDKGGHEILGNCSASAISDMQCTTPAWGTKFKAATTRIFFLRGSNQEEILPVNANREEFYRYVMAKCKKIVP